MQGTEIKKKEVQNMRDEDNALDLSYIGTAP